MKDNNKKKSILPIGTKILFSLNNKTYVKKHHDDPFSKWQSASGGSIIIDDKRILNNSLYKIVIDNDVNEETTKKIQEKEDKEDKEDKGRI